MAKRYWIAKWSMGYVGTDSEEEMDLCDYMCMTPEEVEEMKEEDAREYVEEFAYDEAKQMIDSSAEEDEEKNK